MNEPTYGVSDEVLETLGRAIWGRGWINPRKPRGGLRRRLGIGRKKPMKTMQEADTERLQALAALAAVSQSFDDASAKTEVENAVAVGVKAVLLIPESAKVSA